MDPSRGVYGTGARHVNLVYSVALRQVGDSHEAEEITQAVFIILAKKAATLRHEKALSSWLFQTTRLTANNFIRSEMRRQRREQEAYMQSALNEPETNHLAANRSRCWTTLWRAWAKKTGAHHSAIL